MRARVVLAALLALVWSASARAQYREFERFHPREHFRPAPPVVLPHRVPVEDHPVALHKPARGGDGPICDNVDGDPDAAIAACGRIIARGQVKGGYSVVVAYTHRAQAYENKADHEAAIADFSEAIRLQPGVAGYFVMRGGADENAGKLDAAQGDFRQAMNLDPHNADALNGLKRVETRSAVSTAPAAAPANGTPPSGVVTATGQPPAGLVPAGNVAPSPATGQTPAGSVPAGNVAPPSRVVAAAQPAPMASTPPPAAGAAVQSEVPSAQAAPSGASAPIATAAASPSSSTARAPGPGITGAPSGAVGTSAASGSGTAAAGGAAAAIVTAAMTPPIATATAPSATTEHGPRVALVIGNGQYVNANVLPNPPNDARAIAGVLRQIGFDVDEGENLDRAGMERQMREFLHKAAGASVVLLFYAGHGMQVDGKNYLVPVDAKLAEPSDLAFETIEIDKVLESLGDPGHTNIILLDACRDNPLARSFASHLPAARGIAVASGLAAYSAVGTGTLIAYATAPGQTALDGQGKDSPFTASLLHFLPTPGMEIRQVLTRVRAEVASQTGNRQIPWDNSSLMGDVVLVKAP